MACWSFLREPHGNEDVFLARQHQRRHFDLAEPIGGIVRLDHRELGEVGSSDILSSAAIAAANSAASPGRSSKNGPVKAQSATSRITKGTLIFLAMSAHMANIVWQNGSALP